MQLSNEKFSITLIDDGMMIFLSDEHSLKECDPIDIIDSGRLTFVSDEHPKNAHRSIILTDDGI